MDRSAPHFEYCHDIRFHIFHPHQIFFVTLHPRPGHGISTPPRTEETCRHNCHRLSRWSGRKVRCSINCNCSMPAAGIIRVGIAPARNTGLLDHFCRSTPTPITCYVSSCGHHVCYSICGHTEGRLPATGSLQESSASTTDTYCPLIFPRKEHPTSLAIADL
jgi:hypothetical protein